MTLTFKHEIKIYCEWCGAEMQIKEIDDTLYAKTCQCQKIEDAEEYKITNRRIHYALKAVAGRSLSELEKMY